MRGFLQNAQHRLIAHQRWTIRPGRKRIGPDLGNETWRHRFIKTATSQDLSDLVPHPIGARTIGGCHRNGDFVRNLVVAVNSSDLFNQVHFPLQVSPPSRRAEGPGCALLLLDPQAQAKKGLPHEFFWYFNSQNARNSLQAELDWVGLGDYGLHVDDPWGQVPSSRLQNQLAATEARPVRALPIDATLEAVGGRAVERQLAGSRPHGKRIKPSRLNQYVPCAGRNFALGSPHDASDRDRSLTVSDHAHPRLQVVLAMVDRPQFFPGPRLADHDLPAPQLGEVKSMQRLAALEHHKVGTVHDIVDRVDSDRQQQVLKPRRAGSDLDIANQPRRIARAESLRLNPHRSHFTDSRALRGGLGVRNLQGHTEQHRHFACDPQMPEAIRPVAGDIEIDRPIPTAGHRFFVIQSRHRQTLLNLLPRGSHRNISFQPVPGNNHDSSPYGVGSAERSEARHSAAGHSPTARGC